MAAVKERESGIPPVGLGEHGWEVVENQSHERLKEALARHEALVAEYKKNEKILRQKSGLLDLTHESIYVRDMEHKIIFWNKGAEETYGWTKEEAIGKSPHELLQTGFSTPRNVIESSLSERGRWEGELVHSTRDGKRITVESRQVMQRDRNGMPAFILSINNDITERKSAEEALRESRTRYQSLYSMLRLMCDNVPDLIWAKDMDKKFLFVNKAMSENLLYAEDTDEPIGKTDMFFAERERAGHTPGWHTFGETCTHSDSVVMSTGKAGRFDELGNVRGEMLYLDVHKAPFLNEDGVMIGTVGCAREVTRERQLEQQRRRAEEERLRLGAAIDQIAEGVIVIRSGGFIDYVNSAVCRRSGYAADDLVGKNITDLVTDNEEITNIIKSLKADGKWRGRLSQKNKDGSTYVVEVMISPARSEKGEVNFISVSRDITEEVRLEEERRQASKMEAIGKLAGGIAHDFNNILAVIIGNAELALDTMSEGEESRRFLESIFTAGVRGRDLVQQILTFSRRTERQPKPVVLEALIQETFTMLRASLPTTIEMGLLTRTKAGVVEADPTELQQVLINLCKNAADAMRETGGTLQIALSDVAFEREDQVPDPDMKPGRYAVVAVSDTGGGMTEEVRKRAFEPFYTTKGTGQGTGMGLAVVYGIVKGYGGGITVWTSPGKGSVFTVYLPSASPVPAHDVPVDPLCGKARHLHPSKRILFVDDEVLVVEMAREMLGRMGYVVTGTSDSEDALRTFSENPSHFDLVIADQTMPKMAGLLLARKIKAVSPATPVILCTGYSETISPEMVRAAGIEEYLMKPLVKQELASAIRRALDRKKSVLVK